MDASKRKQLEAKLYQLLAENDQSKNENFPVKSISSGEFPRQKHILRRQSHPSPQGQTGFTGRLKKRQESSYKHCRNCQPSVPNKREDNAWFSLTIL